LAGAEVVVLTTSRGATTISAPARSVASDRWIASSSAWRAIASVSCAIVVNASDAERATAPWSGLSMHPIEHLLYFSSIALFWVVPSHPVHALFSSFHRMMAPVPGHSGFDEIELGHASLATNSRAHYLHHKYFEVNYADGVLPLDKWFGSFHDGTPDGDAAMKRRRLDRAARPTADVNG
jgi:hypothetical protein